MSKCEWQVSCGHADKLRDRYCTGDDFGLLYRR